MRTSILLLAVLLPIALAGCGDSGPPLEVQTAENETAGAGAEPAGIQLTSAQIDAAGIELVQAGPGLIRERLPLYGVIAPNAERVREVAARFPGAVRSVSKRVGDGVGQGEVLATVESDESLQTYSLVAPLSGVITVRNVNPGEQTGGKALFTVTDLSTVWVEVSLFPRDVSKVKLGQPVHVKSTDTGQEADGNIVYVAPFGTASNQTVTARVLLDNADHRWAPGLYVTAAVTLSESAAPLTIRNEAVQNLDGKRVVFVREKQGFAPRPVTLGRSDGQMSEALSGIQAGETYVAANSYVLKAEALKEQAAEE